MGAPGGNPALPPPGGMPAAAAPPSGMPGSPGMAPGAPQPAPAAKQSSVGLIIFLIMDLLSFALAVLLVLGLFGIGVPAFDVTN